MPNGQYSQGQLDAIARQQGFKNYEQWRAWDRNTRQVVLQGDAAAPPPRNWLQNLIESIPGHPAQTWRYISDNVSSALRGNKK